MVRVDSIKPAETMPYELVEEQIIKVQRQKYLESVKTNATSQFQAQPVEADEQLLLDLRDRYDAEGVKDASESGAAEAETPAGA